MDMAISTATLPFGKNMSPLCYILVELAFAHHVWLMFEQACWGINLKVMKRRVLDYVSNGLVVLLLKCQIFV